MIKKSIPPKKDKGTKTSRLYRGPDRRKWPRLERELPIRITQAQPPAIVGKEGFSIDPVWTRDLGGAGLGLNAPVHCPIGSELKLLFKLPGRDGEISATVTVVYSKLETGKKKVYRVGVSYRNIAEDERQAIIYYVNDNLP